MYKWFVHGNSPDGWECVEPRYVLRPQVESLHFTCGEIGSGESAIEVVRMSPIDQTPFYGRILGLCGLRARNLSRTFTQLSLGESKTDTDHSCYHTWQ